ncbi:class I SAM-dependent methyltransferase [Streptomyces sp. NBC_00878]|uniref:class I SAM-dependent methyltransferase n=1 Tax=Streptomyces sp. NBC_00878 TaxID=2975854 RepID=UPI00225098EE|nr:class I SAM-dependent methyltransferase [Streptomyces sp. NBC_00878]MCX4904514.1 class I SAM-dependent methyltransferase [Streptomyces sp. NBC_00878]
MTETAGFENPEFWNSMYDDETAPWLIGEPQPAIAALEREGWIRGRVLEPGCGSGEHTILFTKLGYEAVGVDLSPGAVTYARRTAAEKGVPNARFEVANMLRPDDHPVLTPAFDTIVDCALFHGFGAYGRDIGAHLAYANVLHKLCNPGGRVHILAHADTEPGLSSQIGDSVIRESFGDGWELEDLQPARYQGHITEQISEVAVKAGLPAGGPVDLAAWLVRVRRL